MRELLLQKSLHFSSEFLSVKFSALFLQGFGPPQKIHAQKFTPWEPVGHLQGSLRPSGPETPNKSEKSLPGPEGRAPESPEKVWKESRESGKSPEKVPKRLFRDFFQTLGGPGAGGFFQTFFRLFQTFFRLSGPEGPKDPCKWPTGSQFTPNIVGIPVQFHVFEPNLFHADFLLAGETNIVCSCSSGAFRKGPFSTMAGVPENRTSSSRLNTDQHYGRKGQLSNLMGPNSASWAVLPLGKPLQNSKEGPLERFLKDLSPNFLNVC